MRTGCPNELKAMEVIGLRTIRAVVLSVCLSAFWIAIDGTEARAEKSPTVHHTPPATWKAGQDMQLQLRISEDWELESLWVGVRPVGSERSYKKFSFHRGQGERFVAKIPGRLTQPAGLEYYIGSRGPDGRNRTQFASPEDPYPVIIRGQTEQVRTQQRLARHDGHRSEFSLDGDITFFQSRRVAASKVEGGGTDDHYTTTPDSDRYWRGELEYKYRILETLYDIRFGLGMMRGELAKVQTPEGLREVGSLAGSDGPGLNWGYGEMTFELHRNFSVAPKLMLGASEQGFAPGVGLSARIGPIGGTNLALGVETIRDAGTTAHMKFQWDTVPRFPMGLRVELTDWPAGERNPMGVRLVYDVDFDVTERTQVGAKFGYAARTSGLEAGLVTGLNASYSF